MKPYIEVAIYRLKTNVTTAQFLAAADATTADFQQQAGFISHNLYQSEDGRWLDLLYYESKEAAQAAEAYLTKAKSIQTIMGMLEMGEDDWFHVTPTRQYSN